MRPHRPTSPERILAILTCVLILKVTASIISNYHNYLPPNFASDFLRGRERDFPGFYQCAFYTHIISGPVSLVLGLILVVERSRARFPRWPRFFGRVQLACVLLLVAPSGAWMAGYTRAGPTAAAGLGGLAIATATCAVMGARTAVGRRYSDHRRWMWRCFLLLCSAVVLRLIGGLATVTGVAAAWVDPVAIWFRWLTPLAAFEFRDLMSAQGS